MKKLFYFIILAVCVCGCKPTPQQPKKKLTDKDIIVGFLKAAEAKDSNAVSRNYSLGKQIVFNKYNAMNCSVKDFHLSKTYSSNEDIKAYVSTCGGRKQIFWNLNNYRSIESTYGLFIPNKKKIMEDFKFADVEFLIQTDAAYLEVIDAIPEMKKALVDYIYENKSFLCQISTLKKSNFDAYFSDKIDNMSLYVERNGNNGKVMYYFTCGGFKFSMNSAKELIEITPEQ